VRELHIIFSGGGSRNVSFERHINVGLLKESVISPMGDFPNGTGG